MRSTKSLKGNLHSGFVVRTRNGELFAVVRVGNFRKYLASPSISIPINAYATNLTTLPGVADEGFTVDEIYGFADGYCSPYEALSITTENRPLLWKRKAADEVEAPEASEEV